MSDDMVKVKNVSKIYNVYRKDIQKIKSVLFGKDPSEVLVALDGVSFNVEKGERVAVAGMVGSGRSTLINILAGISSPSKGKVEVPSSINAMLHNRAGLEMEFSCKENVYLKANVVGVSKEVVDEHMDEILQFAEIEDFAELPMKRANRGAPALMSLAVHLLMKSDLMIIDEVFGGGGNNSKVKCEKHLKEVLNNDEDATVIMVSNNISYLKGVCKRTIILDEGKIIYDGPTDGAWEVLKPLYSK